MKERSIIFNSDEVRAVLDGSKTQVRRVVEPPKGSSISPMVAGGKTTLCSVEDGGEIWDAIGIECPYGKPGDKLWVREAWALEHYNIENFGQHWCGESSDAWNKQHNCVEWGLRPAYKADGGKVVGDPCWRACVHMPKWASRTTLEVLDIRVEKVQSITGSDVRAEGFDTQSANCGDSLCFGGPGCPWHETIAIEEFEDHWDSMNADNPWDSNPWVWIVELRIV